MVTITDVSRLANVSKATVSRVMSGSRGVKQESREAVLRAAEELNYRPNIMAQSLATQKSDYIGVVLTSSDTGQVSTFLPLLCDALKQRDKRMLVSFADTPEESHRVMESWGHGQCDAIISFGGDIPASALDKTIAVDSYVHDNCRSISYDYRFACESACRYLSSQGHTSVAILLDGQNYASQQVLEGYKIAMQNMSIPINRQLIVSADESAELAVMNLVNSYSSFTSLIVMKDSHAAVAMKLLQDFNLSTPQDVSILSLEDSSLAKQLTPALTCISYPSERLIAVLMKELDNFLERHPSENKSSIQGNLVVRDSVVNRN
ncbi:LacI family DNA-binding transcriptional regulator [Vibrio gazogenes]|uniref:LacI family transcriptional regulator n=1 Tax=Vibrio gazogenes TaxID=687 RepID=A0A1Z2SFF6_VIBGA|nr:LacI family DNA-binding transcriptional regulator [Vibrio gazogenes]ASA55891.1 LacI family transcriptional regulator [Vibrio gazogenes]